MSWKPQFSVRQCMIGAVLTALLLTWAKNALSYEADSQLFIEPPSGADAAQFRRYATEFFNSPAVRGLTVKSFADSEDKAMASRLLATTRVDTLKNTNALRVSVRDFSSQEDCVRVVDALCQAYLRHPSTRFATLIQPAAMAPNRQSHAVKIVCLCAALIAIFVLYGESLLAR